MDAVAARAGVHRATAYRRRGEIGELRAPAPGRCSSPPPPRCTTTWCSCGPRPTRTCPAARTAAPAG
ncbi:hypothetical protein ACFWYW_22570 [Nonomuraea sp. NPDC059023]|uniref:hypothetical protein n=1 Tax=unclassified Nonomuraea TaxID=2593643 RepID=UPI00368971B3